MAESWPEDLCPLRMTWGCVYNSRAFTSSLSNSQQIVSYPGAYWRCSLEFSVLTRRTERKLTGLIGRMRGMAGTVNVPAFTRRRTVDMGNVVVASASTNALAIGVSGLTVSGPAFREGDYITIGGQMYEVVQDVVAEGGVASIPVNKRVRSTIAPGTPVEYRNPYCEMRLVDDTLSVDIRPIIASGSIELREAF